MSITTNETSNEDRIDRLVKQLVLLNGCPGGRPPDRGTLAALRAWSRRGSQHLAYAPLALLFTRSGIDSEALEDPIWTAIPTLYAWHCGHTNDRRFGFGKTLQVVAGARRDAFDAHFRRLLACDEVLELISLLPRYVRRAEKEGASINFVRLFWDLRRWRRSTEGGRDVKVDWARDYFAGSNDHPEVQVP